MKKLFNIFVIIIILLYIGKVSINTISGKDETVPLKYGSLSESIMTYGYIVMDEMSIDSPIDGKLNMIVKDGTRVPKGKEIAEVVSPSFDKEKLVELSSINDKIQYIKNDKSLNPYVKDIESINGQIDELNREYKESKDSNVTNNIKKKIEDLVSKKEQILKNGPSSIRNLDELYSQKKELEDSISQNLYKIYSPEAGIVSNFFDSYEDILSVNKLFNINNNDINLVKKEPIERTGAVKQGEPIVKLINNYNWYILVVLDNVKSKKLKEGRDVKIDIINDNGQLLDGNIIKMYSISDNSHIAVISMKDAYSDFYKKRKVNINLIINDYDGFIVPNSSIVNENGEYGIYKLGDNDLPVFKEISIKAQNNENAIIESKDDSLKMYDQILINGKDYLKK
ncbi:HlyD family efflux transporter periplasmic adaptor subunit [Thermoanaerobacterium thermosaccharolyticum]|uniref:HlyD family efflux transporter periplasmic adaptor subunit n=1 Tax=Thermoanaerobacterium thermosaccharolyticum TaxID=1517 RepID=UPI003DA86B99